MLRVSGLLSALEQSFLLEDFLVCKSQAGNQDLSCGGGNVAPFTPFNIQTHPLLMHSSIWDSEGVALASRRIFLLFNSCGTLNSQHELLSSTNLPLTFMDNASVSFILDYCIELTIIGLWMCSHQ
jgi:hypothetical protein